jgi:hypothetical protein
MKHTLKSTILLIVLVVVSACSTAFEASGLSADDAALLSGALSNDLLTMPVDYNYSINGGADGDGNNLIYTGHGINDPEKGNSSFTYVFPPVNIEIRVLDESDMYVRGMDPSRTDQWLYLNVDTAIQMASGGFPFPLSDSGLMTDGEVNIVGIYNTINTNLFGSSSNYLRATRAADMDGMAHFIVNLDLAEWISSDELKTSLETLIPLLVGEAIPADELEAYMSQLAMLPMVGALLSDGTYQFDYLVDSESGTLSGMKVTIDVMIDPAMMGESGDPETINFVFDLTFNEFSADSVVVAPEDFIDIMDE